MGHPLGSTVVELGFTTPERVDECLHLQQELVARGSARTLREILLERGYLTTEQIRAALDHMKIPPQLLPGYELISLIGKGGMGSVYQARQVKMNRIVAIKILAQTHAADPDYVRRFISEAQTAAQFNHRNLVAAYDAGSADGVVYFVMEFVKGRSLKAIVEKQGALSERQTLRIAMSVVEALHCLEQRGMVHRDVKPENIMVTDDGVVKLCDFGLAKRPPAQDAGITSTTATYTIVGTPQFMCPEQINGKPLDIRADFYALGGTCYFLATAEIPFRAASPMAILARHLEQPPPDPREKRADLSAGFSSLVLRLMAKKVEDRPSNCSLLQRELRTLLEGTAGGTKPSGLFPPPVESKSASSHLISPKPVPTRKRRLDWIVGTTVTLLMLGAVVLLLRTRPSTDLARETDAGRILSQADTHFDAGRWDEARKSYQEIQSTYATTSVAREQRERATVRIGTCDAKLAAEAKAAKQELDRITAELKSKRWKEAHDLLTQAITRPIHAARLADLQQSDSRCIQELKMTALAFTIETAWNHHRWEEVTYLIRDMPQDLRETESYATIAATIDRHRQEATRESAAEKGLRTLNAAIASQDWKTVNSSAQELRSQHADTWTYRENEKTITGAIERGTTELQAKRSNEARVLYDTALELIKNQKPIPAREHLERLRSDYGDAPFVLDHSTEITELLVKCDHIQTTVREEQTATLYEEAKNLAARGEKVSARQAYEKLLKTFAETTFVKNHGDDIRAALSQLITPMLFDFEDGRSWTPGDEVPRPIVSIVDGAKNGHRCLQILFPRDLKKDKTPSLALGAINGLPANTGELALWCRVDNRNETRLVIGLLVPGTEGGIGVFAHEFRVESEWHEVRLPIQDFKYIGTVGTPQGKSDKVLDLKRVSHIAASVRGEARPTVIRLDDIRAQPAPK